MACLAHIAAVNIRDYLVHLAAQLVKPYTNAKIAKSRLIILSVIKTRPPQGLQSALLSNHYRVYSAL
jgi:hypothetical protein